MLTIQFASAYKLTIFEQIEHNNNCVSIAVKYSRECEGNVIPEMLPDYVTFLI